MEIIVEKHGGTEAHYYFDSWGFKRFHRVGGPAWRIGSDLTYCQFGVRHRLDGPAKMTPRGNKTYITNWWVYGSKVDEDEYKYWLEACGIDINNITMENKELIELGFNRKWRGLKFE